MDYLISLNVMHFRWLEVSDLLHVSIVCIVLPIHTCTHAHPSRPLSLSIHATLCHVLISSTHALQNVTWQNVKKEEKINIQYCVCWDLSEVLCNHQSMLQNNHKHNKNKQTRKKARNTYLARFDNCLHTRGRRWERSYNESTQVTI